jgi:NADH-quinone oxidoreductase subunit N
MTVGNLAALHQENMKRLLAYSSIAHAGYILMGLAVFDPNLDGYRSMIFYIAVYAFMNLGAFLVVQAVADKTGQESLAAYRGLSSRAPWLAVAMAIFLFSLTGIPPMAGFIGKFYLFQALVARGGWFMVLALVGVLNSVVSLFYYARVIKAMYLVPAEGRTRIEIHGLYGVTIALLAVPTVVLGIAWAPVIDLVNRGLRFLE